MENGMQWAAEENKMTAFARLCYFCSVKVLYIGTLNVVFVHIVSTQKF